ncbi:hypothetical protein AZE42_04473 [Rhizopogon vesiculosus]|uniref:Terpenoid synthase n=1 Tax=Rhizopogon vesiculosus TaxID=180088 RepID=A0A1J8QLH9_9AGAM|nr:hypothetical protein AZE42_04473 [Rhizopogon vesiculosus]
MTKTKDSLSTSTFDDKARIRQAIANFLQRCGLQYRGIIFMLDEVMFNECCQEAINRGFPMDGKYSISPYIPAGVALAANGYIHLPDHATKMWICLLLSVGISIDDHLGGGLDMVHLFPFNERFVTCQPQGDPALEALDLLLREAPRHYSPLVSNLIVTSILDFVSSLLLDHETKDMQISTETPLFPDYCRLLSGLATAAVLFIFPAIIPVQEYIQSLPDLFIVMNHTNDILSYYKEETQGDTTNYVSRMAASRSLNKVDVLPEIIDKTVQAHHNILASLEAHTDAYDAYVSFFHGYMKFYAAPRYKLEEIMSESRLATIIA